ncbi:MAG TPA: ATP-binding protein, partial [Desulfobacterales bacterium]|nr:ATP-binding protein [Desulfobacterales bacterium]
MSDLRIITASVARDIQRLARAKKIGFVILSIDEFHLVAPAREETVALQVLRELARIGRHFKIGLILTTQSPQDMAVEVREGAIFKHLRELPQGEGASIREIWEAVREELDDDVTVQAYHKLIDRLEAEGKLDIIADEPTRGKLYAMAPHLHADNPVTLDDIYEYMTLMAPSDAIAQAIDAVDYLEGKKATVLKAAAYALLKEEPVALFLEMIKHEVRRLKAELEVFKETQLRDPKGRQEDRLKKLYQELEFLLYRGLSIPPETLDITPVEKVLAFGGDWEIVFNPDDSEYLKKLEDVLSKRVFGKTFIREIDVKKTRNSRERQRMAVAGTDGSTYSSRLDLTTARRFMEESGSIVTFNTSLAYLEEAADSRGDIPYPYHS